jgi:hypothetical protein
MVSEGKLTKETAKNEMGLVLGEYKEKYTYVDYNVAF